MTGELIRHSIDDMRLADIVAQVAPLPSVEIRAKIEDMFPEATVNYIEEVLKIVGQRNHSPAMIEVVFDRPDARTLEFEDLAALSELLGTKLIDVVFDNGSPYCSEQTPGDPANISLLITLGERRGES